MKKTTKRGLTLISEGAAAIIIVFYLIPFLLHLIPINYQLKVGEVRSNWTQDMTLDFYDFAIDDNDTLTVHIDSPGGYTHVMQRILYTLDSTQADVHCINKGTAASAAGIIALSCDYISATASAEYMFHRAYRYKRVGLRLEKVLLPETRPLVRYMKAKVSKILTKEEMEQYQAGKDIWLSHFELTKRIERLK